MAVDAGHHQVEDDEVVAAAAGHLQAVRRRRWRWSTARPLADSARDTKSAIFGSSSITRTRATRR